MKCWKWEQGKQWVFAFAIVLWMGLLNPELFMQTGLGCLEREDGKEISQEEARMVWESFTQFAEKEQEFTVVYKSRLLEWLKGMDQ